LALTYELERPGVAGEASGVVVSAMKVTFRTLNAPKVTFMASGIVTGEPPTTATPPVTKPPGQASYLG
jgi:hypothetical protein